MKLQEQASVADDSRMAKKYLSGQDAADRLGITRGAFTSLRNLPEPDVYIGNIRGWSEETIDKWNESRPGSGNWGPKAPAKKPRKK